MIISPFRLLRVPHFISVLLENWFSKNEIRMYCKCARVFCDKFHRIYLLAVPNLIDISLNVLEIKHTNNGQTCRSSSGVYVIQSMRRTQFFAGPAQPFRRNRRSPRTVVCHVIFLPYHCYKQKNSRVSASTESTNSFIFLIFYFNVTIFHEYVLFIKYI